MTFLKASGQSRRTPGLRLIGMRTTKSALGGSVTLGLLAGAAVLALRRSGRRIGFRGKVVLITGGSRGLGLGLARKFGEEGARLVLLARDAAELGRAAEELTGRGIAVATVTGDVGEAATAERAVAAAVDAFGGLNVLVNNAGIITVGPLEQMTLEDYERSFAIHLWGPLRLMTAALPHLKKSRGRIVNISSVGGKIAVPHLAPYCASKFALAGLSDAFRAELAQEGVKVTTVFPGLLRTGSHIQAQFKGQHAREFAWFALGAATPLTSVSNEYAVRRIVEACRCGKPELVISPQARLAVLANANFPNLTAHATAFVNRLLPGATPGGEKLLPGHEARGWFPPAALTKLPDRASRRNNELG